MKRIICMIAAVPVALGLTACGEPPTVDSEFEADFSVVQDGSEYTGRLSVGEEGMSVDITAPYTVAGLGFDYSADGLSIRLGGLSANANCDYIPSTAVPEVLHNTLTYLGQAQYKETSDGEDSFTLPAPNSEAEITAKDGVPTGLYDPHSGLSFCFTQ